MTLPLSTEMLEQAYEYLRATPPFNRWKLPDSDGLDFTVAHTHDYYGWCDLVTKTGRFRIAVSTNAVGHTSTLMSIMAHEMVHLRQKLTRTETKGAAHNAAFRKMAARVCKWHGFDPKMH